MEKKTKKREWITYNNAVVFIVILLIISVLRTIFSAETGPFNTKVDLEGEATTVLSKIADERTTVSLLKSNELLEEKVEQLEKMNYDDIKVLLGIKSDFCIFFEDITGNIVGVNGVKSGIGSGKIYINGQPCK